MQHAIWEKIEETEQITSVKVENIFDTKTTTINELIGLLLMQENIPEEGLQELALDGGNEQMREPIDESVLQSLFSKC